MIGVYPRFRQPWVRNGAGGPARLVRKRLLPRAAAGGPTAQMIFQEIGLRAAGAARSAASPYRSPAIKLKTSERLVPTAVKARMAAMAISAAIRPYSIAVTPHVSSITRRTVSFVPPFGATEPSKSDRLPINHNLR